MSTKALLKTSREKLNNKDFSAAKEAAERVLDFEPSNYTAYALVAHWIPHLILLSVTSFSRCRCSNCKSMIAANRYAADVYARSSAG